MFVHANKPILGIIFVIIGVVLGLLVGVIIKKTATEINLVTTLFYRFIFSVPLLLLFAILGRGKAAFKIIEKRTMILRVFFGLLGMLFWVLAIRNLPLGQATALFQSSVIFVTILSPFLLFERVGWFRWIAVVVGLIGIFILTNPFSQNASFEIFYGVLAALFGAFLSITLRLLGKSENSLSVALIYNAIAAVLMFLVVLVFPSQLDQVQNSVLFDLVFLGIVTSFSQVFFTGAYHYVDAVVVASLRYIQVPLAGLTAFFLFAEIMTVLEIFGAVTVIISCLSIGWRELSERGSNLQRNDR